MNELYSNIPGVVIVDKGIIDDYQWFIASYGTHPCAYVKIPKEHKLHNRKDIGDFYDIDVHGDITFTGEDFLFNPVVDNDSWWIGWDYAHSGDYRKITMFDELHFNDNSKKWKIEEIKNEIKNAIEQLKTIQQGDINE